MENKEIKLPIDERDVVCSALDLWETLRPETRGNLDGFKKWLSEDSDFFTAPCSTEFHLNKPGGLAIHSLNVYDLLCDKVARYGITDIPPSTLVICGLGHDLCKVNFYKIDDEEASPAQSRYLQDLAGTAFKGLIGQGMTKAWASKLIEWYKNGHQGERPEKSTAYKVEDQFPMGHGEKSVSILQDFFQLTEIEKLAIRWHMTAFDAGIHFFYPSGSAFRAAANKHPLVTLLFTADYEASQILEAGK